MTKRCPCSKPVSSRIHLWHRALVGYASATLLSITGITSGCTRREHSAGTDVTQSPTAVISPQLATRGGRLVPILTYNSPECLPCAEANCQSRIDQCLSIQGTANAGPAAGTPKSQLCADTLDCALRSRCVQAGSGKNCYCGTAHGLDCLSPKANGSCKSKLEAGLETTVPSQISGSFGDETRGGGVAMQLVQCLINHKCERCF